MRVSGVPFVQGRNSYGDSDGRKYGVAIHNTSNDATAEGEASYASRRTDGVSSHFYVDSDSIIQSLDTNARAGHAGSSAGNQNAIAFEITGTNGKTRAWWLANVAWDKLGRVLAVLCREYNIEPRRASVAEMKANPKVRAFYGHDDMRRAWGGTTHTDPGDTFPWDHMIAVVKAALNGEDDDMSEKASTIIEAWGVGDPTVEPVKWRIRDEAWQKRTDTTLAAVLAAAKGLNTEQILARINEVAAAESQRDAALAELVRQWKSGEMSAGQVVDELARRLVAGELQG